MVFKFLTNQYVNVTIIGSYNTGLYNLRRFKALASWHINDYYVVYLQLIKRASFNMQNVWCFWWKANAHTSQYWKRILVNVYVYNVYMYQLPLSIYKRILLYWLLLVKFCLFTDTTFVEQSLHKLPFYTIYIRSRLAPLPLRSYKLP